MLLGKVLARGQLTLPRSVRRAAGLEQGDVVTFEVTEPGTVQIRALPRLSLREALERYRISEPIDDVADRARWQEVAVSDVLANQDG